MPGKGGEAQPKAIRWTTTGLQTEESPKGLVVMGALTERVQRGGNLWAIDITARLCLEYRHERNGEDGGGRRALRSGKRPQRDQDGAPERVVPCEPP